MVYCRLGAVMVKDLDSDQTCMGVPAVDASEFRATGKAIKDLFFLTPMSLDILGSGLID